MFKSWTKILPLSLSPVYLVWILSDQASHNARILCLYGQSNTFASNVHSNRNAPRYSTRHVIVLCLTVLIVLSNQALQIIQPFKLLWQKNSLFTMITVKGGSLKIIMDANEESPCGKRRLLWTFTNLCCDHYNGQEEGWSFINIQRWKYDSFVNSPCHWWIILDHFNNN